MKNNLFKKVVVSLALVLCVYGVFASTVLAASSTADPSAGGLVTCGRTGSGSSQQQATSCNFTALVSMVNTIIQYLIYIALPLAAISFAYAGWLYMSAGENSSQVSKAKTIFIDVGIGFILVLSAWLVFKLIETTFLNTGNGYSTYLN